MDSNSIHELLKKQRLLNPKKARIISYIIPGSGQIYSGNILRGLSSLILQGSIGTYTYFCFKNGFYFSGVFTGLMIFQMLYSGGARYASFLTVKENSKRIKLYNTKIREFILKHESSFLN